MEFNTNNMRLLLLQAGASYWDIQTDRLLLPTCVHVPFGKRNVLIAARCWCSDRGSITTSSVGGAHGFQFGRWRRRQAVSQHQQHLLSGFMLCLLLVRSDARAHAVTDRHLRVHQHRRLKDDNDSIWSSLKITRAFGTFKLCKVFSLQKYGQKLNLILIEILKHFL